MGNQWRGGILVCFFGFFLQRLRLGSLYSVAALSRAKGDGVLQVSTGGVLFFSRHFCFFFFLVFFFFLTLSARASDPFVRLSIHAFIYAALCR